MSNADLRKPAPEAPMELAPHMRARLAAMASLESALRALEAACIALEPYHQAVQLVGSKPALEHTMFLLANNAHTAIVAGATKLGITKTHAAEEPAAPTPG